MNGLAKVVILRRLGTDETMLAVALPLRGQELSLRDIAARLIIAAGKKEGQQPSPATVLRMLREPFQLPVFCRVSSWLGICGGASFCPDAADEYARRPCVAGCRRKCRGPYAGLVELSTKASHGRRRGRLPCGCRLSLV